MACRYPPASTWETQPLRCDQFSGLQRVRSRYSIGFDKLMINHAVRDETHRVCSRGNSMKTKSKKSKRQRAKRHPRVILRTLRTLPKLKRAIADISARRGTIALVPTMGALHAGHFSLVRIAKRHADRVIVSIFVNPAQFAPNEDLGTYPRSFASDLA